MLVWVTGVVTASTRTRGNGLLPNDTQPVIDCLARTRARWMEVQGGLHSLHGVARARFYQSLRICDHSVCINLAKTSNAIAN